jgi:hypothetical protein
MIGYSPGGYGIQAERDARANLPTESDLDACHGRTSAVNWDGKHVVRYHRDRTREYPYTLGRHHATPADRGRTAAERSSGRPHHVNMWAVPLAPPIRQRVVR